MKTHRLTAKPTLGKLPFSGSFAIAMLCAITSLTACSDKPENPPVSNTPTNQTEKDVPMSAKPADTKAQPIAVGEEGKAETGAVVASGTAGIENPTTADSASAKVVPVVVESGTDATAEGGADNSGMDKISENDQVIDDTPASPDAPKAQEEKSEISNAPTGTKKK